jgi:hypothetical protein
MLVQEVSVSFLLLYSLYQTNNMYHIQTRKRDCHTSYVYVWYAVNIPKSKMLYLFIFRQRFNLIMVKVIKQLNPGSLVFNPKIWVQEDLLETNMRLAWMDMVPIDRKNVLPRIICLGGFNYLTISREIVDGYLSYVCNFDTFIGPIDYKEVLRRLSLWIV